MIGLTYRIWNDVVDVETLPLSGEFGLVHAASLASVSIPLPGRLSHFLPICSTPVVSRRPAFPRGVGFPLNVLGLPRRIAVLRAKNSSVRPMIGERFSALTAFETDCSSLVPACFGAIFRSIAVLRNLKHLSANSAFFFDPILLRADLPPASVPTRAAAKSPCMMVCGEGVSAVIACLFHSENIAQQRMKSEYVADIRRRIAHVSGQDTPLFGGAL